MLLQLDQHGERIDLLPYTLLFGRLPQNRHQHADSNPDHQSAADEFVSAIQEVLDECEPDHHECPLPDARCGARLSDLLVCNLGISLYFSIVEFIRKRRKTKAKKKIAEVTQAQKTNNASKTKSDELSIQQIFVDESAIPSFIESDAKSLDNKHLEKNKRPRISTSKTIQTIGSEKNEVTSENKQRSNHGTNKKTNGNILNQMVSASQQNVTSQNEIKVGVTNRTLEAQKMDNRKASQDIIKIKSSVKPRTKKPFRLPVITDMKSGMPASKSKSQAIKPTTNVPL